MNVRTMVQASMVAALVACGGGSPPPPQTAASPGAELDSPPSSSSASSGPEPSHAPEFAVGMKAFDAGNFADARASFQAAAKKNPNDYEALFNVGTTSEKLNDRPAAEQAYKSALAVKPDLDSASVALSSLYLDEGHTDDALATARAGLSKRPGSGPLHENLGIALATRGDQDEAIKEFEQALQITSTDPMYHLTLAHWLNAWHMKGALPHIDAARDLAKDDYAMTAEVGYEYRIAGELDSCIKTFDREIAAKDGGEVRTERALCRLAQKDDKGALEDLEAAVAKEPSYPTAHYYLAGRLALAKKFKEAAAEYGKYLSLAPDGSLARQATERMKAAQDAAKSSGKKR